MPTLLLTGAGRGLGLEFARQYRDAGWRVIATARDPDRAEALQRTGAELHALDVTDLAATAAFARRLAGEALDLLIANAGISGPRGMTPDAIDEPAWVETMRVNALAPLALAGAFRPHLARSGAGKAIAISSRLGSIAATSGGHYAYRASKAALNMAWRSLAQDAPELVCVVLHPGWVRTDMGGAAAPVAVPDSIAGMRFVIERLGPADSGRFFDYAGEEIPW